MIPDDMLLEISKDPFATENISTSVLARVKQLEKENPEYQKMIGIQVKIDPNVTVIGGHQLGKKLGEGGFGAAFLSSKNPREVVKVEWALRPLE